MAADFAVLITDAARTDLEEILEYLSENLSNPSAAIRFLDELEKTLSVISAFPQSGKLLENPLVQKKDIRTTMAGKYVLYYCPDHAGRKNVILRVVYGARERNRIEMGFI